MLMAVPVIPYLIQENLGASRPPLPSPPSPLCILPLVAFLLTGCTGGGSSDSALMLPPPPPLDCDAPEQLIADESEADKCEGASFYGALAAALYQFAMFFATPLTTQLSDKYGRRRFFIIGFMGSSIGFMIIAVAGSNIGLLVGRFIGGFFSASPPLAQAYISDSVPPERAPAYRARLMSCFQAALVFGPGFGGGLAQFGNTVPFFASSGMAFMGFLLSLFFLDEPQKPPKREGKQSSVMEGTGMRKSAVYRSRLPLIYTIYCATFLVFFGFQMFIAMFGFWLFDKLGWGPGEFGFVTTATGALPAGAGTPVQICLSRSPHDLGTVGIIANLGFFARIAKWLGGMHKVAILGTVLNVVGWLGVTATQKSGPCDGKFTLDGGLVVILALSFGHSVGFTFYNTAQAVMVSMYADKAEQGKWQGRSTSIQAIAGFTGPLLGGWLYENWNWELLPLLTSGCNFLAMLFICRVLVMHRRLPENTLPKPGAAAVSEKEDVETAEDGPLTPTEREELEALREEVKELRSLMSGLEEMLTEEQFSSLGASSSLAQVVNPRLTMH